MPNDETADADGDDQSHTYSRDWLVDYVYYISCSKQKADVVLLKLDSSDAWFADASIDGTPFNFLMDSGVSKSVMSLKQFLSIPDLFRPKLCNTIMKFQVPIGEVINAMGVAHVSVRMYGYMFKLPIIVCDLGELDCIFGLDAGKIAGFVTCAHTGRIWFNVNEKGDPEPLSRSSCNAICHLRAVNCILLFQIVCLWSNKILSLSL